MSLFQCSECGCCENTALCNYHWRRYKKLPDACSACEPDGKWHGEFERVFLPKGMFVTNRDGNLAHKQTGDTDFRKHAVMPNAQVQPPSAEGAKVGLQPLVGRQECEK